MINLVFTCSMAIMLFLTAPTKTLGTVSPKETKTTETNPFPSPEAEILLMRLDEINALDKSGLSAIEKKKLRDETKELKYQLKNIHGGVFLSTGALIVILILLIILI